jgi:hypothetical protein
MMSLPSSILRWAPVVLATFTLGCNQKVVGECDEETPCPGFSSCVDGECIVRKCSTSADCGMEAFCDNGECAVGCSANSDCYPGDACNSEGACVTAGCRETSVDCEFGQYCDPNSGDCYNASGLLCSQCGDNGDCGGDGNQCINFGSYGSYCGATCSYDSDCPAGYMCLGLRDEFGNIVTTQCITYCWLYIGQDAPEGPPSPSEAQALLDQRPMVDLYDGVPLDECPAEVQ